MKSKKWKPLLLLLPCVVVFTIFLILDQPNKKQIEEKSTVMTQKETDAQMAAPHTEEVADTENITVSNPDVTYETYHLVIGSVGSLEEGGSTPIYYDPDEESEEISKLQYNCAVIAASEQTEEDWICVELPNMQCDGYVKKDCVEQYTLNLGSEDPVRDKIIKDAMSYLSLKFVRYGKSLETGIDCSNFIQQIYRQSNIEIPNKPLKQKKYGKVIEESMAQPGDIVFYDKANNGYGHVALYLGDGMMINSSGHSGKVYPKGGVRICRLLYHDRDSYLMVNELDAKETDQNESNTGKVDTDITDTNEIDAGGENEQ